METLTFLSPHPGADRTPEAPTSCFSRRGALGTEQRHRKPQGTPQTAYNENLRLPRKVILEPDFTCSCLQIMPPESTKRVWAHAGERAKMRSRKVCLDSGVGLDGWRIVVRRSLRCARVLVGYLEVSPTEYSGRGGGARTLSSARSSSVFVTHIHTSHIQTRHAQNLLRRRPNTLRKSD